MTKVKEKRNSPIRRQFNQAFCSPDGNFSPIKTVAVFSQISVLYHFNVHFADLIPRWDSLVVILTFLIAPNTVHKLAAIKFGGAK